MALPPKGDMMALSATVGLWVSMAKTLFWRHDPPPILGGIVSADRPERMRRRADKLVEDVNELDRVLKRRGIHSVDV